MSSKAAGAYLTISEVSDKLGVPAHVLRFWETKFTQVKPLKRSGGRRYYREADIELLSRIRHLLYKDGFTIKGAQKALKSPDAGADHAIQTDETSSQVAAPASETMPSTPTAPAASVPTASESMPVVDTAAVAELRQALDRALDKVDGLLARVH